MERVSQSSLIFFYLLAAFVVFITMRGELRVYLGLLIGAPANSTPSTPETIQAATAPITGQSNQNQSSVNSDIQMAGSIIRDVAEIAPFLA